jgi:hypothetical protein
VDDFEQSYDDDINLINYLIEYSINAHTPLKFNNDCLLQFSLAIKDNFKISKLISVLNNQYQKYTEEEEKKEGESKNIKKVIRKFQYRTFAFAFEDIDNQDGEEILRELLEQLYKDFADEDSVEIGLVPIQIKLIH